MFHGERDPSSWLSCTECLLHAVCMYKNRVQCFIILFVCLFFFSFCLFVCLFFSLGLISSDESDSDQNMDAKPQPLATNPEEEEDEFDFSM